MPIFWIGFWQSILLNLGVPRKKREWKEGLVEVNSESHIKIRVISQGWNYCVVSGVGVGGEKKLRLV